MKRPERAASRTALKGWLGGPAPGKGRVEGGPVEPHAQSPDTGNQKRHPSPREPCIFILSMLYRLCPYSYPHFSPASGG